MENAVQFEREPNTIRVKHLLSAGGIDGIELRTVLEALDVSQKQCFVFTPFLLNGTLIFYFCLFM